MKVSTSPSVRFTQKAFQQITALTRECEIEISAMGVIANKEYKRQKGVTEDFYILEFHVPEQECCSTSTTIEAEALSKLTFDLMQKGVEPEQICVWWHSHVNMGVGHSATDEKQIENFNFDKVCISIITNKKGNINIRADIYNPIRYSFEECPYMVEEINILDTDWACEMVEKNVTEIIYTAAPPSKWHSFPSGYTKYPPKKKEAATYKGPTHSLIDDQDEYGLIFGDQKVLHDFGSTAHNYEYEEDMSDQPEVIQILADHFYEGRLTLNELLDCCKMYDEENIKQKNIVNGDDVNSLLKAFKEPKPKPKQSKNKKRK
ncbi:MAG: hypothetical protein CL582_13615 [Alteromonadaceae bacterium]|nr:hypothetical protein [Alteromonadaceae bacterium]